MQAIEINSKTDRNGHLQISYKLNKSNSNVRVLILIDDVNQEQDQEELWLNSISGNPAFDFLNAPDENIYDVTDGKPIND